MIDRGRLRDHHHVWAHRVPFGALCVLWVGAVALFLLLSCQAQAHGWYDADCCEDKDCRPIADNGVRLNPGTGVLEIKFDDVWLEVESVWIRRPSLDSRYHLCVSSLTMMPKCLYEPPGQ